jgi:hypothetical protein
MSILRSEFLKNPASGALRLPEIGSSVVPIPPFEPGEHFPEV